MKIFVARHGETNYNVLKLHNADPKVDVHLTEKGISEAKNLAEELKDEDFDAIYVSELPRTGQTASYLQQNSPRIIDARLNDINSGFEGKSVAEYHKLRDSAEDPFTYKAPNGESSEEVYLRTKEFLQDLKNSNYNQILIITSKHNFRHFKNIIDKTDPRKSLKNPVKNTEILIREI